MGAASNDLTGPALERRMGTVPKVRRSIGVALMMALVLSIGVQCVVGQEMTTAQMACCVGTDHDCGSAAAAEDCCQSERAGQEQLLNKVQIQQLVPPLAFVTSAVPALTRPAETHVAFHVNTTELKGASPPKYVLLAAFLI